MLTAYLCSPLLASAGVAYLHELDKEYLSHAFLTKNSRPIPLVELGFAATKVLGDKSWKDFKCSRQSIELFPREIMHLYALKCLLHDDFLTASSIYIKLLEQCPGDGLALSMIMDVAKTLGKPETAFR